MRVIWEVSGNMGAADEWVVLVVAHDPTDAMRMAATGHSWDVTKGLKIRGVEALFAPEGPVNWPDRD